VLNDTICAISTALKDGAISIVRMSGDDSFNIVSKLTHLKDIKPNTIVYGHIFDKDELIDEVLISFFKGPKSYTREDMVEINCHGGIYVTKKILDILLENGCRLALPGEFTKRAYLNGRIDLSKADSINDLVKATNKFQARSAIKGINGSVYRLVTPLMDTLKDIISRIEVTIDYPEYEDLEEMSNDVIKPELNKIILEMNEMIEKALRFEVIKDGLKTVIVGKPNVGKSSLLNALLKQDKAIVTDVAGTTRDLVEGKVSLKNITLNLIDTAGIRDSSDKIEKIGIEKSKEALDDADLVILVLDSNDIDDEDHKLIELTKDKKRVIVYNKSDLNKQGEISISAKNGDIDSLVDYLNEEYKDDITLVDEDLLNNSRQIALMKKAKNELEEVLKNIDNTSVDVIVISFEEAYHSLCEILGKEYQEDLIDHMFRNFCLGK